MCTHIINLWSQNNFLIDVATSLCKMVVWHLSHVALVGIVYPLPYKTHFVHLQVSIISNISIIYPIYKTHFVHLQSTQPSLA
jgi:hypothetical protein